MTDTNDFDILKSAVADKLRETRKFMKENSSFGLSGNMYERGLLDGSLTALEMSAAAIDDSSSEALIKNYKAEHGLV